MNDQAKQLRNKVYGRKKSAKTIAVVSGKGGVGKSNVVVNMGIELQKMEKKVLIIDLDVGMGNIEVLLGEVATSSIVDFFNTTAPISDMVETGPNDLKFIAGSSGLNDFFELDSSEMNHFTEQYEQLSDMFDYIFFDMGAGVTRTGMNFILAADECILVTTPEPTAITDAYSMIKQIVLQDCTMKISLILNRCQAMKEGIQGLQKIATVTKHFLAKEVTSLGVLLQDPLLQTAVKRQTPFVLLKPNAPISKSIRVMAARYVRGTGINEPSDRGFVSRLRVLFRKQEEKA